MNIANRRESRRKNKFNLPVNLDISALLSQQSSELNIYGAQNTGLMSNDSPKNLKSNSNNINFQDDPLTNKQIT